MKLNHVLVHTTNLSTMTQFWTDVIGLQRGPRPPFPFRGAWMYSDDQPLVHIAEDRNSGTDRGPIAHVAIEGGNYKSLMTALNQQEVDYVEKDVPLPGERQVFVAGPDELTVEMLFPLGTTNDQSHPY